LIIFITSYYLIYFVTDVYLEVKRNRKSNCKVFQLIPEPFAAWKEGFVAEANAEDKD
jgi:hypothetical protein